MNLAQLIEHRRKFLRLTYEELAECSHAAGAGLSASYFCLLANERRPLKTVTVKMIAGVAAALGVGEDQVAEACWVSLGYTKQPVPIQGGTAHVISKGGLSAAQARDVTRHADNANFRMEANANGAGDHQTHSGARAPLFSHDLPNPRPVPRNHDGSNGVPTRKAPRNRTGTDRTEAAS